jgi:hypothetical protein
LPPNLSSGFADHSRTLFDASDMNTWVATHQFNQESAGPLTYQQRSTTSDRFIQV